MRPLANHHQRGPPGTVSHPCKGGARGGGGRTAGARMTPKGGQRLLATHRQGGSPRTVSHPCKGGARGGGGRIAGARMTPIAQPPLLQRTGTSGLAIAQRARAQLPHKYNMRYLFRKCRLFRKKTAHFFRVAAIPTIMTMITNAAIIPLATLSEITAIAPPFPPTRGNVLRAAPRRMTRSDRQTQSQELRRGHAYADARR